MMKPKFIILRGNSGSGKSTIAKQLQLKLGYGTMLVQQDVVRREILRVKDTPENPAIELIEQMVLFGERVGYNIILEGILPKDKYGEMLTRLISHFGNRAQTYYFDISFEETLRRHTTKPNPHEYGEKEMREWWQEKDFLGNTNEIAITENMSRDEILTMILKNFNFLNSKT